MWDGRFFAVAYRHEQAAALNHPSQPRGRALMHDVPSAGEFRIYTLWRHWMNTVTATITVGHVPFYVAVSPDGSKVYLLGCKTHCDCRRGS
jgi:hypothetical protein